MDVTKLPIVWESESDNRNF